MSYSYLDEVCSFLMRGKREVDLGRKGGGEDLAGVEGGGTIIRIYCVRKYPIFSKRRKKQKMENKEWV